VTILAMINATSAAILDRTYDLAAWRALGLERGRLIRVLVVEAAVLGLLGGVLGIGAGALIGQTFVKVVAPTVAGFRMAVTWPVIWSLFAVILTMAFAGATASLVARSQTPRPVVLRNLRA
jgi:putative ABC transport system permease protein